MNDSLSVALEYMRGVIYEAIDNSVLSLIGLGLDEDEAHIMADILADADYRIFLGEENEHSLV